MTDAAPNLEPQTPAQSTDGVPDSGGADQAQRLRHFLRQSALYLGHPLSERRLRALTAGTARRVQEQRRTEGQAGPARF